MNMSEELRECPLCSKKKSVQIDHYDGIWYVMCNAKLGGCGTTSGGYENEEESVSLWNTRYTPTHETVQHEHYAVCDDHGKDMDSKIKCLSCGTIGTRGDSNYCPGCGGKFDKG